MRKTIFAIALILISQSYIGATEFQIKSGKRGQKMIVFPYGSVNGISYWKQTDYESIVATLSVFSTATLTNTLITPTAFEINLSTCALNGFEHPEDFISAQTYKGILPYLDELEVRIQSMNRVGGKAAQRADIQARLDYLSSVARSLP